MMKGLPRYDLRGKDMVVAEFIALILALLLFVPLIFLLLLRQWAHTPYGTLDLRMAFLLKIMRLFRRFGFQESRTVEWNRRRTEKNARLGQGRRESVARIEDAEIDSGSVRVRIYDPGVEPSPPVVLYYHGGGMVSGSIETHDGLCRLLAAECEAVVVSVGYRLAPEHPFPAAVEDAYEALRWAARGGGTANWDRRRIAVAGDSAGGNLAAVVAQMARDRGGPQPACQILIYPVTDISGTNTPSYIRFEEGYGLSRREVEWCRARYLPRPADWIDPYASPLLASNLEGLVPAFILAAEFDVLRDDAEAYAEKLREAGSKVTFECCPGVVHGFLSMSRFLPHARRAAESIAGWLKTVMVR